MCAADYWELTLATFETFTMKLVSLIENRDRIVFVLVESCLFIYTYLQGKVMFSEESVSLQWGGGEIGQRADPYRQTPLGIPL